ncbi:type II secretion system F family protein [Tessaracoccus palaemonis]|uniref:Type II secretion system F family protein n=1 Tax=Tessaracoccus palaemonis TaxID=2829499 RepID=A0ABX8SIG1_9ACTN|nr:type II secretion system F family protein [Tessaracoccus palaemonis]QXT62455.1 type II secretion system F family protein [Tessaracoccus palaemonis]
MIAAVLAGLAALLLITPPPARGLRRLHPPRPSSGRRGTAPLIAAAIAATALAAVVVPWAAGWVLVAAVAAGTVILLATRHRRRAAAAVGSAETARAARLLAALLRAGHIPQEALAMAATDSPMLAPAATAARLGADVPEELRRLTGSPGGGGGAALASAWRVAERSGAPVAAVLGRTSESLRAERALAGVVEAELAAARASGRIMAALPFGAVLLGTAAGADPVAFLLASPAGGVLVLVGTVLTAVGVLWIDRLAENPTRRAGP